MYPQTFLIVKIVVTLLFSAFFSGIEIAFVSSDKLQLQLHSKNIPVAGRLISYFIKAPSHFMGATLVGNTLSLVLFGIFMTELLQPILVNMNPEFFSVEFNFFIVQTLITTFIVLMTAEFLPKSIFLINPVRMMTVLSFPLMVVFWILYLPMMLIITLSKVTFRLFGLQYREDKPVFGMTDLNNYVKSIIDNKDTSGIKVEIDAKILINALDFKTVKIRDCMIPRTEISAVDIEDGVAELKNAFIDSGHSKILIYKDSIDNVIGYCHGLDMFKKPKDIQSILSPVTIVPETLLANELMIQFINEHKSLALVVDEYGGTSGVVTMEDIIEEIFGEIQDEHDDEEWVETQLSDTSWLLSARLEIDYLNEKYGWELPEGDYETLGGLFLSISEEIPKEGDLVTIKAITLTINKVNDTRIETIKLQNNLPNSNS
ncbi:MAG: hemolysin family protein [Cyclobacteriaceae bacterium]|nr:hemolysin family protein [Cyclobacteriaceae bacterium]